MNKNKFYLFIIAALLISNLLTAAILFFHRPPGHERNRDVIIHRLHFDQEQIKQYDVLIQQHQLQWRKREDEIMTMKNLLYSHLSGGDTLSPHDELNKIASAVGDMEGMHYQHFQQIHELCKPDQQEAFKALAMDLSSMFAHGMKRR